MRGVRTSEPRSLGLAWVLVPPLVLLVLLTGVLGWQVRRMVRERDWVEHSDRVIAATHDVERLLVDMETGVRGYKLSSDAVFLEPYERARQRIDGRLRALEALVAGDEEQARRVAALRASADLWRHQAVSQLADVAEGRDGESLGASREGKRRMDALRRSIAAIVDVEERRRAVRTEQARRVSRRTSETAVGLALAVAAALALLSRRQLLRVANAYGAALDDARSGTARLQLVTDAAPVLILEVDRDLVCQLGNRAAADWFGVDEVAGRPVAQLFGPEALAGLEDRVRLALDGHRQVWEQSAVDRRGRRRWVRAALVPERAPGGWVRGLVVVVADLTARRRAEEELARSEERYRSFVNESSEGIWRVEFTEPIPISLPAGEQLARARETGVIAECNEALAHMQGLASADQLIGVRVSAIIQADHPSGHETLRRFGQSGYRLSDIERTVRWPNGEERVFVETMVGKVVDGRLLRVWGIRRDITERRRIDAEREALLRRERAAREEAERVARLKEEFLATVSHELRTPLHAILGFSSMLARGVLDPARAAKAAATIERNARLQTHLVEDLLDLSRVVSGQLHVDRRPTPLAEVVEAALEMVRPAVEARGLVLEAALDPVGLVECDGARMQQVAWNLLANAIKFTPTPGTIAVRLERVGDEVELRVRDSGPGIAPDFLPFVFERFRQADSSTTRRHGGLGIGLSLVRSLVELQGGSVRAESAAGQGTTFVVRLPAPRGAG